MPSKIRSRPKTNSSSGPSGSFRDRDRSVEEPLSGGLRHLHVPSGGRACFVKRGLELWSNSDSWNCFYVFGSQVTAGKDNLICRRSLVR
jgi:hypothetical protein